jgi:peptidoglycan hydrolase CwlO-like protein
MKRLQAEIITAQTQKHEWQDQMELLQEWVEEVLAQAEESKAHIAQTQEKCMELISIEIAVQIVDTLKEKTTQV